MTVEIPEVSVVIPCKNGGAFLITQLEHLSLQTRCPQFEVIISDNGSTDGAPQKAITLFSGRLNISIVDSSLVPGISYARNIGAQHAKGKYILFCDADDYVEPNWIYEIYTAFIEEKADVVGGRLIHSKINPPHVIQSYGITEGAESPQERFTASTDNPPAFGYKPSVAGCNFGSTREMYFYAGGMDLSFIGGSEETDFTWRALNKGAKMVFANKALVNYRLRTSFKGIYKQQFNYQKTRIKLWMRYRSLGMSGPSVKYSVESFFKALPGLLNKHSRLHSAYLIGGNLGALYGMIIYRFFKHRISELKN
ncbi:glycosyltransferase [Rothia nasimurium]|uniref:glycosyltransferase n=1 Tax=Rothia nasimurium TaxID=85336 RepID=UPI001F1E582B|nr:glycosyltransferase family 2 protein [Rothia nasimurium]